MARPGGASRNGRGYIQRLDSDWSGSSTSKNPGGSSNGHVLPSHRQPGPPTASNGYRAQQGGGGGGLAPTATASGAKRNLTRAKTLTRPDRHVTPAPLINPHLAPGAAASSAHGHASTGSRWWRPWTFYIYFITFLIPRPALAACGIKSKSQQRAWREKVALCSIALLMGGFVGFITIGMQRALCPADQSSTPDEYIRFGEQAGYVGIEGWMFNTSNARTTNGINFQQLATSLSGQDVTYLFDQSDQTPSKCSGQKGKWATVSLCTNGTSMLAGTCTLGKPTPTYLTSLGLVNTTKRVGFSWEQVENYTNYMVLDGLVVNMSPYIAAYPKPDMSDLVDSAIRTVLMNSTAHGGKDGTRLFFSRSELDPAGRCIAQRYKAGSIDKITPGCFFSQLFLYLSLAVIMSVILARFFMALIFSWFLSSKLVKPPKNLKRRAVSPAVLPAGANSSVGNGNGAAPWTKQANAMHRANTVKKSGRSQNGMLAAGNEKGRGGVKGSPSLVDSNGMLSMAAIGAELFCVNLVTCYSEGYEGIKSTLDSIAGTDYADSRKLLFVVCDGMITGSGEKMSTPDICVSLLDADPRFDSPQPMSYLAVAGGKKQHNQAMVYAGHYTQVKGHRTPTIIVVKTGTPEEARDPKPGNRGKRDSQMILMHFFSRVTYNDRMTPLDYDLFRKVQALMGVTPDFFEVCLMVDADTKVFPDSMKQLVNCMQHDNMIMGVCGETRIANKRQSWVTMIQVYEYYISHHLSKAFESVFGGVTCLPGCFSMYRLKARKANEQDWVPVLTQSGICSEYSQSEVDSLHEKNLLLLGEDRFLTTLMLRTFPHRKMMFCPQARCRTIAPDTFKVLLSQRRRWINSTIHNLMELVQVSDLCGTFCFSMQFMVFMDLVGTVVLPVAICLTYSLVVQSIIHPPKEFADAIPLLLLAAVLGLPAVLILLATGKVVYVSWMLIYLVSLPIWNFVLPVYSYWHFDDFSWGQTRMVAGEKKDVGHGDKVVEIFDATSVPLRRWEDWERSRLRRIKRENKRKQDFERSFGTRAYHNAATLSTYGDGDSYGYAGSDGGSQFSGEEDRWGMHLGVYPEDANYIPPTGLYTVHEDLSDAETVDNDQMGQMLDAGWADEEDDSPVMSPHGSQDGHRNGGYPQPRYNYPGSAGTPPPMGYHQPLYQQNQQPPPRMYHLADTSGHEDSNSSLTRLTTDVNESNPSLVSPRSPVRAVISPDSGRHYDNGYYGPLGPGPDRNSPSKSSAYDAHPPGQGHVKRRSGGGSGSAAHPRQY